jgi:hypothetical protein
LMSQRAQYTIDFVSIFGTEGFSSVLTLDIVSVFGIMDVK